MLSRVNRTAKRNPLLEFFNVFFKNLHKVVALNLLFFLCSIPAIVLQTVLYMVLGNINIFSVLIFIVTVCPFSGGLTVCCRKLAMGENFNIFKEYLNMTRKNALHMLKHSFIAGFAVLIEYLSLASYFRLAQQNTWYWVSFSVSAVLGIFLLFCSYSVAIMSVTYDLKMKQLYKNAALLTVGAFKYNVLATFTLCIFLLIVFSMCLAFGGMITAVLLVIFAVVLIPASACVIVSFVLFPKIKSDIEKANLRDLSHEKEQKENVPSAQALSEIPDDLLKGDMEEFVFFNGRMYKRSALLKMKTENDAKT